MNNGESFKQKVLRIFDKNGGGGKKVKIFEHLPPVTQQKLLEIFDLQTDEVPIIGGSADTYFLLTNKRIFQFRGKEEIISLNEIVSVKTDLERVKLAAEIQEVDLDVILTSGQAVSLKLEKSSSFFGIWNVLLFIVSRNAKILS